MRKQFIIYDANKSYNMRRKQEYSIYYMVIDEVLTKTIAVQPIMSSLSLTLVHAESIRH